MSAYKLHVSEMLFSEYLLENVKHLFVFVAFTAEPHTLVIHNATSEDTGMYGCTARNSVSYNTSEERVTIECKYQMPVSVIVALQFITTLILPIFIPLYSYDTDPSRLY